MSEEAFDLPDQRIKPADDGKMTEKHWSDKTSREYHHTYKELNPTPTDNVQGWFSDHTIYNLYSTIMFQDTEALGHGDWQNTGSKK